MSKTNGIISKVTSWKEKYFPERQIFLRSDGQVKFVTLSGTLQLSLIAFFSALGIWTLATSFTYLTRDLLVESKNEQIAALNQENASLSKDFETVTETIKTRTEILKDRQEYIESVIEGENTSTEPAVEEEPADIDPNTSELMFIERVLGTGTSYASSKLSRAETLLALETAIKALDTKQQSVAKRILAEKQAKLATLGKVLADTPLNVEALAALPQAGIGGPEMSVKAFQPLFHETDPEIFVALQKTSERLFVATTALNSFPTGKPAAEYYISSRFGVRTDPFTKKKARHGGLDMAGWPGTDIYATNAGTVTKAGTWGAYGRMVEIDHGNGIKTRYGHMQKLSIKRGDIVTEGQKIGYMGKTGRATSSHLHYEILVNGKVHDPLPFLKAADDVRKIQGRNEEE